MILVEIDNVLREEGLAIRHSAPLSGGFINHVLYIEGTGGKYCLKYNSSGRYPGMFEAEMRGLQLLTDAKVIRVPCCIMQKTLKHFSFILLEYIKAAGPSKFFWQNFGVSLAHLHQKTSGFYGLEYYNYMGALRQTNSPEKNWVTFYITHRLEPQISLARDKGYIDSVFLRRFDRLCTLIPELIPEEQPALLHGDLWNGNYLIDERGEACLIDPAVYFGHREVDLAMTCLFGGFRKEFYDSYQDVYPLEKGWVSRVPIFNLYPLLIHLNLFGSGYLAYVRSILERFQ